ncbi:F0F1 ATP synthase subunit delta [Weissella viridescens]|uniref:ATP synthase subunit delta n=1 Tax=Weissella viridescens TaxID=1629 RepID=A0A3P2RGC0_WEIVI|nr:ATP synthase F1 subunit delta [Weissella viridescens]RRG18555.1 F0F1 ATP synthase subunit delta [Weissella viridescens]
MAKLTSTTVGKRYAKALFELTQPEGTSDATLAELMTIADVFSENPDLMSVLTSVNIPEPDKQALLKSLTKDASALVQHLFDLVYENRRIADLPMIIQQYKVLVDRENEVVTAKVTTAIPLDDAQTARLSDKLKALFKAQTVVIENDVDPKIIGGVKIEANDRVLDGTISTKLANIRQSITD